LHADSFDESFIIVFIDADMELSYGPVPLKRQLLANAIEKLADAGAKGIVLKFFLDQADDQSIANALASIPVVLQARIDDREPSPNHLAARFTLTVRAKTSING